MNTVRASHVLARAVLAYGPAFWTETGNPHELKWDGADLFLSLAHGYEWDIQGEVSPDTIIKAAEFVASAEIEVLGGWAVELLDHWHLRLGRRYIVKTCRHHQNPETIVICGGEARGALRSTYRCKRQIEVDLVRNWYVGDARYLPEQWEALL